MYVSTSTSFPHLPCYSGRLFLRSPHLQQIALNLGISNTTTIISIEDCIVQSDDLPFFPHKTRVSLKAKLGPVVMVGQAVEMLLP